MNPLTIQLSPLLSPLSPTVSACSQKAAMVQASSYSPHRPVGSVPIPPAGDCSTLFCRVPSEKRGFCCWQRSPCSGGFSRTQQFPGPTTAWQELGNGPLTRGRGTLQWLQATITTKQPKNNKAYPGKMHQTAGGVGGGGEMEVNP